MIEEIELLRACVRGYEDNVLMQYGDMYRMHPHISHRQRVMGAFMVHVALATKLAMELGYGMASIIPIVQAWLADEPSTHDDILNCKQMVR